MPFFVLGGAGTTVFDSIARQREEDKDTIALYRPGLIHKNKHPRRVPDTNNTDSPTFIKTTTRECLPFLKGHASPKTHGWQNSTPGL